MLQKAYEAFQGFEKKFDKNALNSVDNEFLVLEKRFMKWDTYDVDVNPIEYFEFRCIRDFE